MSLIAVEHAETDRLWHSRHFWERTDKALSADGELRAFHDSYRVTVPADPRTSAEDTGTETATNASADIPPAVAVAISGLVTGITIIWANGETTAVHPFGQPNPPLAKQTVRLDSDGLL